MKQDIEAFLDKLPNAIVGTVAVIFVACMLVIPILGIGPLLWLVVGLVAVVIAGGAGVRKRRR